MENEDKFKIEKLENGEDVVVKNGRQAVCPFKGMVGVMVPAQLAGQAPSLQMVPSPCTSDCIFFRRRKDELFLTCTLRSINIKEETKIKIVG